MKAANSPNPQKGQFLTDFLVEIFLHKSLISHILCSHTCCVYMPELNV
jgi:hypothetical protein